MYLEPIVNLAEPLAPAAAGVAAAPCVDPPRLCLHPGGAPRRAQAEAFIRGVYAAHYGATIRHWAPTLVTLEEDGRVLAAAGYRPAQTPLFLERYLALPVQQAIAVRAGVRVARHGIIEVGHFASAKPGAGRRLMALLGRHLAAAGHVWVVSTATDELRRIFERLRIRALELGCADPALLGAAATDWGSYYRHAPLVLAGEIRSNLSRFAPVPVP